MVCNRFPTDWSGNSGEAQGQKRPAEDAADAVMEDAPKPALEVKDLSYQYGGGATIHDRALSEPKLIDVSCAFERGCRVLVSGANGAGKSTLLSIMGGKRMLPRGKCLLLGKEAFHDTSLNKERMYCGDWWRTNFFFNITVAELIGVNRLQSARVQELVDIMQINLSWRINAISDGQRRRCQLLECLAEEKQVYVLDEITTDLDLYAREGLLDFLKRETENKGATVFYATHIFDSLADWATHCIHFSKGRIARCCKMEDLKEYHDRVANGTRTPLYSLMKEWVFREYSDAKAPNVLEGAPIVPEQQCATLEVANLKFSYVPGATPNVSGATFSFNRGARILVVGANGACKSTIMSILGGKRMIPRGFARVMGNDCFNDPAAGKDVMYCGDWWNTNFFMNLTISEVIGSKLIETQRCKHLTEILDVDLNWKINNISDGQRRRCQLLEILAKPRPVYLMDEITSDLDIYAREGILGFLKAESEQRGCTVFYCTHIFDELEGWPDHLLHLSKGNVVRACHFSEVEDYHKSIAEGCSTPLYSTIRKWIYSEYAESNGAKPWRVVDEKSMADGRIPNLGLAGPFQTSCG
jgi:CCR4-NOT complex subunit CAF16